MSDWGLEKKKRQLVYDLLTTKTWVLGLAMQCSFFIGFIPCMSESEKK